MSDVPQSDSLRTAQAQRDLAYRRLRALQFAALLGQYDEAEYAAAVAAYREAEALVYAALRGEPLPAPAVHDPSVPSAFRDAFAERAGTSGGAAAAAPVSPPHEPATFQPTGRMRFVKWLVETGRLSDYGTSGEGTHAPRTEV